MSPTGARTQTVKIILPVKMRVVLMQKKRTNPQYSLNNIPLRRSGALYNLNDMVKKDKMFELEKKMNELKLAKAMFS
jgi:hypothetical protein